VKATYVRFNILDDISELQRVHTVMGSLASASGKPAASSQGCSERFHLNLVAFGKLIAAVKAAPG
jgi:hypothetical protein